MQVGILTGGGDCPGLNAAIRAVVRKGDALGDKFLGILGGWGGLLDGKFKPLALRDVSGILHLGGTILGTSRTNPFKKEGDVDKVLENIRTHRIDAIVAIGGEDTLGVAAKLSDMDVQVVGIPKTIDNDLNATDFTIGFDTAVTIAAEAVDRLHTTAESHNRVMVVEVMGRHAGWVATHAGLAGGADMILIPERPFKLKAVCDALLRRHHRGKLFSIVVVAEGAKLDADEFDGQELVLASERKDAFGHVQLGGIGEFLRKRIEDLTGYETRVTVLGHTQRGGMPTARDRILATRYGIRAIELIHEGNFGKMVSLEGEKITEVPLADAVGEPKLVPTEQYEEAEVFFG